MKKEKATKQKWILVKDGSAVVFDDRWITINADEETGRKGQHVLIKENGTIVYGLGGKYKHLRELGGKKNAFDYNKTLKSGGKRYESLVKRFDSVAYNEVSERKGYLSEEEIVAEISGGDLTKGSCFSLACAYAGQKFGLDVRDFRGDPSRYTAASNCNNIVELCGNEDSGAIFRVEHNSVKGGIDLLKKVEAGEYGKEYIFTSGTHAAVVRKSADNGNLEYLELQSEHDSGWKELKDKDGDWSQTKQILRWRFGCKARRTSTTYGNLIDIEKLNKDKLRLILGYINTEKGKELKGERGGIR